MKIIKTTNGDLAVVFSKEEVVQIIELSGMTAKTISVIGNDGENNFCYRE